jgi:hypothetical protein
MIETNGDITYQEPTDGCVYGLVASDEPLQIRYVGQTITPPETRLRGRFSKSGCRKFSKCSQWIKEVQARGCVVRMRILGRYALAELNTAERQWIAFWARYCDLTNKNFNVNVR